MKDIYITGHRNPDMDSTCSAVAYSALKNQIDSANSYVPIRCGHLNAQTKYVFKLLNLEPPRLVRDIYPKVNDIVINSDIHIQETDPLVEAMSQINNQTVSIIPVFNGDKQTGLVSINEISSFFINEHTVGRPIYGFNINNFDRIFHGSFYSRGEAEYFKASIVTGAMPYKVSIERIRAIEPLKPVLIVGERYDFLNYAVKNNFPAIILTGVESTKELELDIEGYKGTIYLSQKDTAETTRLLRLSIPVSEIMGTNYPRLDKDDFFDEAKQKLIGSDFRGLPVYNKDEFCGIVSRRCFIDRPIRKVILVDHNEARQSVPGIENGEIVEIIDHHRLAAEKTSKPIYIASIPVGSTCTIVHQHYRHHSIQASIEHAKLLLAGILSDTVLLKSPTTTEMDKIAVEQLAKIAGIDWTEFGKDIFSHTSIITEMEPEKVISTDFKIYEESGVKIGVGQVEVTTLENLNQVHEKLLETLELVRVKNNLDWTLLLVTNVIKENSVLFSSNYKLGLKSLIYRELGNCSYDLPGILSRKKQLLPELIRVVEEISR